MKSTRLRILPLTLLALTLAALALTARDKWDKDATRRKAEYIFLESQNAMGQDLVDEFVAMVNRAYELDSADIDIAAEWGYVILVTKDDSLLQDKAYKYLKRRFLDQPDNYTMSLFFADIANQRFDLDDMELVWTTIDSLFPAYDLPAQELARTYLLQYALLGDSAKLQRVFDIYNRLEAGTGKTLPLMSDKLRAYYISCDTVGAEREMEDMIAYAPADSRVAMFVGGNYEFLEMYDKALKYYDRACELDSTNGQAYMSRANIYLQMGDSVAYDREVFQALKSSTLEVESKIEILRSYVSMLYDDTLQEGRIRELFQTLETQHAGEPDIHNLYASYLYEIGDYAGSAEQMEYSIALEPNDESAWSSLVQANSLSEDYASTVKCALEARARFPDNLYFPIMAADAYNREDSVSQALAILEALEMPNDVNPGMAATALSFKGDLLAHTGDTLRALEAYDLAVAYDPAHIMAYNNAAYFMAVNNMDLDKAMDYIQKVMLYDDRNPTYLDTYAWVLFKLKQYKEAKEIIDRALKAYVLPTAVLEMEGIPAVDYDEGFPDNPEMLVEEPSADIYEHAGDIYFMNGDPAQALVFWKKALAQDPDNELLKKKVKNKTYFFK